MNLMVSIFFFLYNKTNHLMLSILKNSKYIGTYIFESLIIKKFKFLSAILYNINQNYSESSILFGANYNRHALLQRNGME